MANQVTHPTPYHALGGANAKTVTTNAMTLVECVDLSLISIALGAQSTSVKTIKGISLPKAARSVTKDNQTLMWLASDMLLYEQPYAQDALEQFSDTVNASLSDQSDVWVALDLQGDDCISVLERLVILDVAQMTKGAFMRTSLHHCGILLRCMTKGTAFRIYAPRSYARSVHHAIELAMLSCEK